MQGIGRFQPPFHVVRAVEFDQHREIIPHGTPDTPVDLHEETATILHAAAVDIASPVGERAKGTG